MKSYQSKFKVQAIQVTWENWKELQDLIPGIYMVPGCYLKSGEDCISYLKSSDSIPPMDGAKPLIWLRAGSLAMEGDYIIVENVNEPKFRIVTKAEFEKNYEEILKGT